METEKLKTTKKKPETTQREVKAVLPFSKIPLDKVAQILQDFVQVRDLEDGTHEAGYHIRVELQNGQKLEGWVTELDHQRFRYEALVRHWPGAFSFSVK